MTCREVLAELGEPTKIRRDGGTMVFDYHVTGVAGVGKLIRFTLADRLVCQVSVGETAD